MSSLYVCMKCNVVHENTSKGVLNAGKYMKTSPFNSKQTEKNRNILNIFSVSSHKYLVKSEFCGNSNANKREMTSSEPRLCNFICVTENGGSLGVTLSSLYTNRSIKPCDMFPFSAREES